MNEKKNWTPGQELHRCPYCGNTFTVKVANVNLDTNDEFWDNLVDERACWGCGKTFTDFAN